MLEEIKTKVLNKEALDSLVAYSVFVEDEEDFEVDIDLDECFILGEEQKKNVD